MSPDEEALLEAGRAAAELKKLLALQCTPEEYESYRKNKTRASIRAITGFLNRKILEAEKRYELALFLESGHEEAVRLCEDFYELTYRRDRAFLDRMAEAGDGKPLKILVTGGYHAPNLKHLLRQRNISYVSLQPRVLQQTNLKRYEDILLRRSAVSPELRTPAAPSADMTTRTFFNGRLPELTQAMGLTDSQAAEVYALAASRLAKQKIEEPGKAHHAHTKHLRRADLPADPARFVKADRYPVWLRQQLAGAQESLRLMKDLIEHDYRHVFRELGFTSAGDVGRQLDRLALELEKLAAEGSSFQGLNENFIREYEKLAGLLETEAAALYKHAKEHPNMLKSGAGTTLILREQADRLRRARVIASAQKADANLAADGKKLVDHVNALFTFLLLDMDRGRDNAFYASLKEHLPKAEKMFERKLGKRGVKNPSMELRAALDELPAAALRAVLGKDTRDEIPINTATREAIKRSMTFLLIGEVLREWRPVFLQYMISYEAYLAKERSGDKFMVTREEGEDLARMMLAADPAPGEDHEHEMKVRIRNLFLQARHEDALEIVADAANGRNAIRFLLELYPLRTAFEQRAHIAALMFGILSTLRETDPGFRVDEAQSWIDRLNHAAHYKHSDEAGMTPKMRAVSHSLSRARRYVLNHWADFGSGRLTMLDALRYNRAYNPWRVVELRGIDQRDLLPERGHALRHTAVPDQVTGIEREVDALIAAEAEKVIGRRYGARLADADARELRRMAREKLLKGGIQNGVLSVSLADFSAYLKDSADGTHYEVHYANAFQLLKELLPELSRMGVRRIYLNGMLYPVSNLPKQVHTVPHAGEHFFKNGRATVRVNGYATSRTEIDMPSGKKLVLTDREGNSFSIPTMMRFNRYHSKNPSSVEVLGSDPQRTTSPELDAEFEDLVRAAAEVGIDFTVDYIPWFSPDSVDETNYKRFFYRELPEHLNRQYREKGSDEERRAWVQNLVRISPGWFAVELPEEGSADKEKTTRVILVKHLENSNVDQAIPNPFHPENRKYYREVFERFLKMGVYSFRVDLGHLLLKKNTRGYFQEIGALNGGQTGETLEAWIARSGMAYDEYANPSGIKPGELFDSWWARQQDVWDETLRKIYKGSQQTPELVFETYSNADQNEILAITPAAVYHKGLFSRITAFLAENKDDSNAQSFRRIIDEMAEMGPFWWRFLSNFDQNTIVNFLLKYGWDEKTLHSFLAMALAAQKTGAVIMIDESEWYGRSGRLLKTAGGNNYADFESFHPFIGAGLLKELQERLAFVQAEGGVPRIADERVLKQSAMAQVLTQFPKEFFESEIIGYKFLNNSFDKRFLCMAFETKDHDWFVVAIDLKPKSKRESSNAKAKNLLQIQLPVSDFPVSVPAEAMNAQLKTIPGAESFATAWVGANASESWLLGLGYNWEEGHWTAGDAALPVRVVKLKRVVAKASAPAAESATLRDRFIRGLNTFKTYQLYNFLAREVADPNRNVEDDALKRGILLASMLSPDYWIRGYAANTAALRVRQGGLRPQVYLSPALLNQHVADPLLSIGHFDNWNPVQKYGLPFEDRQKRQARRNKRYAILWTISHLVSEKSTGEERVRFRANFRRKLSRMLKTQAAAWTPARDQELCRMADEGFGNYTIGEPAPINLLELMRLVKLRSFGQEMLATLRPTHTDPKAWVMREVNAIVDAQTDPRIRQIVEAAEPVASAARLASEKVPAAVATTFRVGDDIAAAVSALIVELSAVMADAGTDTRLNIWLSDTVNNLGYVRDKLAAGDLKQAAWMLGIEIKEMQSILDDDGLARTRYLRELNAVLRSVLAAFPQPDTPAAEGARLAVRPKAATLEKASAVVAQGNGKKQWRAFADAMLEDDRAKYQLGLSNTLIKRYKEDGPQMRHWAAQLLSKNRPPKPPSAAALRKEAIESFVKEHYYAFLRRTVVEHDTAPRFSDLRPEIEKLFAVAGVSFPEAAARYRRLLLYLESAVAPTYNEAHYVTEILNREIFIPNGHLLISVRATFGTGYWLAFGDITGEHVLSAAIEPGRAIEVPFLTLRLRDGRYAQLPENLAAGDVGDRIVAFDEPAQKEIRFRDSVIESLAAVRAHLSPLFPSIAVVNRETLRRVEVQGRRIGEEAIRIYAAMQRLVVDNASYQADPHANLLFRKAVHEGTHQVVAHHLIGLPDSLVGIDRIEAPVVLGDRVIATGDHRLAAVQRRLDVLLKPVSRYRGIIADTARVEDKETYSVAAEETLTLLNEIIHGEDLYTTLVDRLHSGVEEVPLNPYAYSSRYALEYFAGKLSAERAGTAVNRAEAWDYVLEHPDRARTWARELRDEEFIFYPEPNFRLESGRLLAARVVTIPAARLAPAAKPAARVARRERLGVAAFLVGIHAGRRSEVENPSNRIALGDAVFHVEAREEGSRTRLILRRGNRAVYSVGNAAKAAEILNRRSAAEVRDLEKSGFSSLLKAARTLLAASLPAKDYRGSRGAVEIDFAQLAESLRAASVPEDEALDAVKLLISQASRQSGRFYFSNTDDAYFERWEGFSLAAAVESARLKNDGIVTARPKGLAIAKLHFDTGAETVSVALGRGEVAAHVSGFMNGQVPDFAASFRIAQEEAEFYGRHLVDGDISSDAEAVIADLERSSLLKALRTFSVDGKSLKAAEAHELMRRRSLDRQKLRLILVRPLLQFLNDRMTALRYMKQAEIAA